MYNNYIDVIVSIQQLIIAYRLRNEPDVVRGLELALQHAKSYKEYSEEHIIAQNARKLFDFL